jgi:DNA repair protein SbcC/Rad50
MLDDMVESINRVLKDFDDPFAVRTDEGLSFTAQFPDSTIEVAPRLSGGQKVVLALAFRLAVNSLFAGEAGMMFLDEPTVFLDGHNVSCLGKVLAQLQAITRKRGQQIIMITHEEVLERGFDQLIRLGE